jgi:hypothetical protein
MPRFALAAVVALAWAGTPLRAQLVVSRNVLALPARDSSTDRGFLPRVDFFGEAQRGFGSAADELAWNVKLGARIELYRWSARTSLVGVAGHEMTANPFNSIGFNPRGAIWEESLLLWHRTAHLDWWLGPFHRCRHEIDNSHPPDESRIDPSYEPTARLLSLTGVHGGVSSRPLSLGAARWRWYARAERYATTTDNREPRNTLAPFWKRALGSATLGGRIARDAAPDAQLYAHAWGTVMTFSRGPDQAGVSLQPHWRSEAGLRITGRGGAMDLYTAYERTFDDLTRPTPQPSGVFGIGVRFGPR